MCWVSHLEQSHKTYCTSSLTELQFTLSELLIHAQVHHGCWPVLSFNATVSYKCVPSLALNPPKIYRSTIAPGFEYARVYSMVSVGRGVECRVVLFGGKKLWDKWCRAPNAFYTVLYLRRCLGRGHPMEEWEGCQASLIGIDNRLNKGAVGFWAAYACTLTMWVFLHPHWKLLACLLWGWSRWDVRFSIV